MAGDWYDATGGKFSSFLIPSEGYVENGDDDGGGGSVAAVAVVVLLLCFSSWVKVRRSWSTCIEC